MTRKRTKHLIDPKVQGTLVVRVVLYWLLCSFGIFVLLAGVPIIVCAFGLPNPPPPSKLFLQTWLNFWPAVVASLLLLPIVLTDVVRLSHRFVGPAFKMRRALRDLADGKDVEDIRFREKDFWGEFATDFNRLAAVMRAQRTESTDQTKSHDSNNDAVVDTAV